MATSAKLILNVSPITFSREHVEVGRLAYQGEDSYKELRERHWNTHVFRFDERTRGIANVAVAPHTRPLGSIEQVAVQDYLLLLARAITRSILLWVARDVPVLRGSKDLLFWGQADSALLLTRACETVGVQPTPGLEVRLRYHIDCRTFRDRQDIPYLGTVLDVDTANIVDVPVASLVERGMSVVGMTVCVRGESLQASLYSTLRELGRIIALNGSNVTIAGTNGKLDMDAKDIFPVPRIDNFQAVIEVLYATQARRLLEELDKERDQVTASLKKLAHVERTLLSLNRHKIVIGDELGVSFGELLREGRPLFPERVATSRPPLLFGPQGRNVCQQPDEGITTYGPYLYMQHARTQPIIAVVCEARRRGQVEQFMEALRIGFPDTAWDGRRVNPYRGGLVGKFRLSKVRFEYEETKATTASAYREAAMRLLSRLPETPDLAFVQIQETFRHLSQPANPYYASKAAFMAAGVPTQSVTIEKMQVARSNTAYLLNSIAVATYAKLDGLPWVISTPGSTTHELVLGVGSSEVAAGHGGIRNRYVGITTLFQGDGRYLVWGLTREVPYDEYPEALLETLRTVIRYMEAQNGWEEGDKVRLICHVYKRLKDAEVEAVKSLVQELLEHRYQVEFAFLDISWTHPYRLFSPSERGVPLGGGAVSQDGSLKGVGFPARGTCLLLDSRRALLHLTGPREVKQEDDGLPVPLLLELHPDSDFTDLTYLSRQIFHFTYMSWRGFLPASDPVTIAYSKRIASMLGNLKLVPDWDSNVISLGPLRGRLWFL